MRNSAVKRLILPIAALLAVMLLPGCGIVFDTDYHSGYNVYDSGESELDASAIDELYLNTSDAYVNVAVSDEAAIRYEIGGTGRRAEGPTVDFSTEDGRLTVNYDSEGKRGRNCIITVELPADSISTVTADFTSGVVEIQGFHIETLNCLFTSGAAFISDAAADGIFACFTTGAMELNGIEVRSLSLGYSSGHVEADEVYAEEAEFLLASGSVNFSGEVASLTADLTSGAAMYKLYSAPGNINAVVTSGALEIRLDGEPENGFTLEYEKGSGVMEIGLDYDGVINSEQKKGTVKGGALQHEARYSLKLDSGVLRLIKD